MTFTETLIENYMGSLIDELKQSRPIAPTEPVFLAPELTTTEDRSCWSSGAWENYTQNLADK